MPGHPLYRKQLRVISDQLSDRLTCCSIVWHAVCNKTYGHHVSELRRVTPQVERKKKSIVCNVEKSHKSARVSPML